MERTQRYANGNVKLARLIYPDSLLLAYLRRKSPRFSMPGDLRSLPMLPRPAGVEPESEA